MTSFLSFPPPPQPLSFLSQTLRLPPLNFPLCKSSFLVFLNTIVFYLFFFLNILNSLLRDWRFSTPPPIFLVVSRPFPDKSVPFFLPPLLCFSLLETKPGPFCVFFVVCCGLCVWFVFFFPLSFHSAPLLCPAPDCPPLPSSVKIPPKLHTKPNRALAGLIRPSTQDSRPSN